MLHCATAPAVKALTARGSGCSGARIEPAAPRTRCYTSGMDTPRLVVQFEHEEDGRWIAEVLGIPGALVYGQTRAEALAKAQALALRVLADRLEHGESVPEVSGLFDAA